MPSLKEQKRFDTEYPKKQKFNKTDLAKYEMSWRLRPHDASKGGEKNFILFLKEIDNNIEITKQQYHQLIAKAILFQEIDKLVTAKKLGGYKANVVSYSIALIAHKTSQRLNLANIWQLQGLTDKLRAVFDKIIDAVWIHITTPSKQGMNITEWCKKQECWLSIKDKFIDISAINDQLTVSANADYRSNGVVLTEHEIKMIEEASIVKADSWFSLAKWAKENGKLTPFDRKLAYNLGALHNRKVVLSPKQAKNALRIINEARSNGCLIE